MTVKLLASTAVLSLFSCMIRAQQSCPKWGPYVTTKGFKNKEGILQMAAVMMPAEGVAPYTYACSVQFNIGKSGGYCGIQKAGPEEHRPANNIFSIWDFPNKVQIIPSYKDPITFVGGFGGEGTGLHSHADFDWKLNQWYTNIVRCWNTPNDTTTSVGYFIYDHTAGSWKHYVTFIIPQANARLHGEIGSFLENFADDSKKSRTANYKAYWMLQEDGKWLHPDTLLAEAGAGAWKSKGYEKDGAQLTSCGTDTTGPSKYLYTVSMESQPAIITKPAIYDMATYYDKGKKMIHVDWSMLPTATPQLSYKVAVYANEACTGTPLITAASTDPEIAMISLPVDGIELKTQDYYVTLQIKDIFEQETAVKKETLHDFKP